MDLFAAAESGDIEAIRTALQHGASTPTHNDQGRTPLMVAIASQQAGVDAVNLLLKSGCNPNELDRPKFEEPFDKETSTPRRF